MIQENKLIDIPGLDEPLSLSLTPEIMALRKKALDIQTVDWNDWDQPEVTQAEYDALKLHTDAEDWRLWRGRRFDARLNAMNLDIERGEKIVCKPIFGPVPKEAKEHANEQRAEIREIASYATGDTAHFHPNFETIFALGVGGLLEKIDRMKATFAGDEDKETFYDSCRIAMEGFQSFVRNVAAACRDQADGDEGLLAMAELCDRIAVNAPQTFHEACELMFLVLVASWFGEEHVMTCYGRMDRTLGAFYEADVVAGILTPQEALNIISCMYIQLNRFCPASLADGVIVGGRDGDGRDVTNTVSYLALAARQATHLCFPTLAVAWHEGTPDEMMEFSMTMLGSGINDPAFFSDDVIPAGLQDLGVSVEDSHNFMNSTCVEIKTVGNGNIWVATRYFNCTVPLLEAMRMEAAGEVAPAKDLAELQDRTREIIREDIRETAVAVDGGWDHRAEHGCMPFASCIIDDCLDVGLDHDRGGCRYEWAENSFVGLANLADSLVTVDELVYQSGEMTLAELHAICEANFEGHELLRQRILNQLPSYGNDNDRADELATVWADDLCAMSESNIVAGKPYVPGFFCHMNHAWLGLETGATPDGRLAGVALADGAGAAQGRDTASPTASVLSTTKWSHKKALGGLVHNVRFGDEMFANAANRAAVRMVVETFMRRGGFEIQVNMLSAAALKDAQENPDAHKDLVVRVAGYSDYFTMLMKELQDEVIARTEFSGL
jgi:pyruvate-formate lyase